MGSHSNRSGTTTVRMHREEKGKKSATTMHNNIKTKQNINIPATIKHHKHNKTALIVCFINP